MGLLTHFIPPILILALPAVIQFSEWQHPSIGSLSASINGHRCHPSALCMCSSGVPAAKSPYLWSSPIFSGCSSRHPWSKPQLSIFPPLGSSSGRSSGVRLAILLLWHVITSSPPKEVVLQGVGLVHLYRVWLLPIQKGTPTSDAWWEEASFSGGLMTVCVGSSLCRRARWSWFVVTPPKSLHPTCP